MALSEETRARLKKVSTATLATAHYKRGFRNQFIHSQCRSRSRNRW